MKHTEEPADFVLVGCVKRKLAVPALARDIYASPLWRFRREYAEQCAVPWFILSAKHGLLDPDTYIEPYDLALADLPSAERRDWSHRVLDQFREVTAVVAGKTIEVHAGKMYVEYGLERELSQAGANIRRPLAQIPGIGSQIAWYKTHLESQKGPQSVA